MASCGNSTSTFNFSFNWSLLDFSKCNQLIVKSQIFEAPPPFNRIGWKLWVHPNGYDERSKGYVAVMLEMVNDPMAKYDTQNEKDNNFKDKRLLSSSRSLSPSLKPLQLTSASVIYKLGIMNAANKMIDHCLEEQDFNLRSLSRPKLFMRNRLIMINCREAESLLKSDNLTLKCEVTYSESLLQQIVPSFDLSDFGRILDSQSLTDITIHVTEDDESDSYDEDNDQQLNSNYGLNSNSSAIHSSNVKSCRDSNVTASKNDVIDKNNAIMKNNICPNDKLGQQEQLGQEHLYCNHSGQGNCSAFGHSNHSGSENCGPAFGHSNHSRQELSSAFGSCNHSGPRDDSNCNHLKHGTSGAAHCHELRVHKLLLAARSPVFERMLTNDMIETKLNKIEINDLDYEVVKEMIDYMYTGFVSNLSRYALDLLFASEKYCLHSLKIICEQYLISHLNLDNVINVLLAANLLSSLDLQKSCIDFITKSLPSLSNANQEILETQLPEIYQQIQKIKTN